MSETRSREYDALLRAEELNRRILQALPGGIVHVRVDGSIATANEEALRILGLSFDEITRRYTADFTTETIFEDGSPCSVEDYPVTRAILTGEDQPPVTIGVRKNDGRISWAVFRAIPLRDPISSEITGAIVTFLDVTSEKEQLNQLAEKEDQLRRLIENFPHYVISFNLEGQILFVNRTAPETTKEKVLSRTIFDYFPESMHETIHSIFKQLREEQKTVVLEQEVNLGGTIYHYRNTYWPEIRNGKVVGINNFSTDISSEYRLSRQLEYRATHDALTGLTNRFYLEDQTAAAVTAAHKTADRSILVFIDLDQFKMVNDSCGHMAGDELLKQISALLKNRSEPTMTLSRLGGDEFAILARGKDLPAMVQYCEELKSAVEEARFVFGDSSFRLSMSIGITEIGPDTEHYSQALREADMACYAAKEDGRNQIHIYRADDLSLTEKKLRMNRIQVLRAALDLDRLELYFQRIVSNHGDEGKAFEILLRLPDSNGLTESPERYIAAAEQLDLMPELDLAVIRKALGTVGKNQTFVDNIYFFTINLSVRSISNLSFQTRMRALLAASGIPPAKVAI